MGKVRYFRFIIPAILLIWTSSCYKDVELPPDPDIVFELSVTPEMQEFIYNSRDTSYIIEEPGMEFLMGQQPLDLDEIRTRGKTALHYQRKSFAVKLNKSLAITGRIFHQHVDALGASVNL